MGDDIRSGSVCFDFCETNVVHVVYGRQMTIDDSLSLNLNRCHHPLITQLSFNKNCVTHVISLREFTFF